MTTKVKITIFIVSLLVSFAGGRWLAPIKIKTEIKTIEVEKKTSDLNQDKDKHLKTTVTEITKSDGTKIKTSVTTDDTSTHTDIIKTDDSERFTDKTKEVTRSSSRTNLYLFGGYDFTPKSPVYGGMVSRDVLGPISIGVWGLSDLTFGASVGISF